MSTPYRNFWIIVGMTAGATFLANISSKPKTPHGENTSARYQNANSGSVSLGAKDSSAGLSGDSRTTPFPTNPNNSKVADEQKVAPGQTSARQSRNIEEDLKMAFDVAVKSALAQKIENVDSIATATDVVVPPLPSLITKDIKSTPQIAIAPVSDQKNVKPARTITNLNMRKAPDPTSPLIEILPTGTVVAVIKEESGWVHILVTETGRDGWVNAKFLRRD
ncbi:SH3 domain-containing protein [Agrobacterium tumefaciens]|uniref:SH3 domain-containing protein n=1 Tax=Agrobacterium tumefaciens TaxID=358 RepID=UPI001F0AE4F1|nr:SH3 domain-containing protein [Agrobacterium tumefaciens]